MIQRIKGILLDGDDLPLANMIVEAQFSYGESQLTGPGVLGRTDSGGAFDIVVYNNAEGIDTVGLTLENKIIHTLEFDPEDAVVDIGTLNVEGVDGSRPRLSSVPDGIKIYRALLTQANTDAPAAVVFENTLGGTVVWSRVSAGLYLGTLADAFVEHKTVVLHNTPMKGPVMSVGWAGPEAIQIETAEISIDFGNEEVQWASADNLFGFGLHVQVLVYP